MIQLSTRRHTRFLENILVLIAECCILCIDTNFSCLVHNRPHQCTLHNAINITTNHICKCFCWHNVDLGTFCNLLRWHQNLFLTQHTITTGSHSSMASIIHVATFQIWAWLTHAIIFCQTRQSNKRINPTYWWVIPLQNVHANYHICGQTLQHTQHSFGLNLSRVVRIWRFVNWRYTRHGFFEAV